MAHTHSMRENPGQLIMVAGLAAAVGAATALLTAPKKGSEMRSMIKEHAQNMKHSDDRVMEAEKEKVKRIAADRAATLGSKVKDATKSSSRHAKTAVKQTKKDTTDLADEIRRNGEP